METPSSLNSNSTISKKAVQLKGLTEDRFNDIIAGIEIYFLLIYYRLLRDQIIMKIIKKVGKNKMQIWKKKSRNIGIRKMQTKQNWNKKQAKYFHSSDKMKN